jgi:hypothetical protein
MPITNLRRINLDGTRNVWCSRCYNFICTVSPFAAIHTALCVVCQLEDDGVDITPEQYRQLRSVKVGEYTLTEEAAFPASVADPMTQASPDEIDTMVGRTGYFLKALVKNIRAGIAKTLEETEPESKKIAKEKKRRSLWTLPIDQDKEDDKK